MSRGFHGSYLPDDVEFLLEVDNTLPVLTIEEREARMATEHYGTLIPAEGPPDEVQRRLFDRMVKDDLDVFAEQMRILGETMAETWNPVHGLTIVSLARAGTPIGVLLTRLLRHAGYENIRHYSVSILRDKGIDRVALATILSERHPTSIRFVDGWTGKGTIAHELRTSASPVLRNPNLWVVSDPGGFAERSATRDDVLLPIALLNATISGLISRTVVAAGPAGRFHRCRVFEELAPWDVSQSFVTHVMGCQKFLRPAFAPVPLDPVQSLADRFGVARGQVKLGRGETVRALLRRRPLQVILQIDSDTDTPIFDLAEDRNIPVLVDASLSVAAAVILRVDASTD